MILYQYMQLQYLPSCFENGIYASRLEKVNDPYEGFGINYPDQYRICCMTKSPLKMLMWAYYVNHRGCCVGFDVGDDFKPVEYITTFLSHEEMSIDEVIESLYTKGKEWNHEDEYRAVYYEPRAEDTKWIKKNEEVYYKAPVVSVLFGLTAEMNPDYLKSLTYLIEKGAASIEYSKCKLKNKQYQLYKDKQFDIVQERNKYELKTEKAKQNTTSENGQDGNNSTDYLKNGQRIVRIKREIEETLIDRSWVKTHEDRLQLAREPWRKFKCHNIILKDPNIEEPDYNNGLSKVEPFDLYDNGILVGHPSGSKKVRVSRRNSNEFYDTEVYIVCMIPYKNMSEFDIDGSPNYPYPTIYCKFIDGSPFTGTKYIDKQTFVEYKENEITNELDG